MKKFIIPNLASPFEYQLNKYVYVLEDYALEWVIRFNLLANESSYNQFSKAKIFLLIASCYPSCKFEELKIANDTLSWIFIWDDECDLSDLGKNPELLKAYHQRFLEILNGAELITKDIPLAYALKDIRERMLQIGNHLSFNQFVLSFEEYFNGCVQESINRIYGIIPNVDDYTILRRLTVGGGIFLSLIEFSEHLEIRQFSQQLSVIVQLNTITINILAWCNDIFSASREIASGDIHNLVFVLHNQDKISLEDAMKCAAKMHNEQIEILIHLERHILGYGENSDMTRYISGLHSWISGNLNWYGHSGRYQTVEKLKALAISNS